MECCMGWDCWSACLWGMIIIDDLIELKSGDRGCGSVADISTGQVVGFIKFL